MADASPLRLITFDSQGQQQRRPAEAEQRSRQGQRRQGKGAYEPGIYQVETEGGLALGFGVGRAAGGLDLGLTGLVPVFHMSAGCQSRDRRRFGVDVARRPGAFEQNADHKQNG